jgi:hypothetical protein
MNWYKIASRSIEQHIHDVIHADLNSPILITQNYSIIDGAHRTAKAYILGKKVNAIILSPEEIEKTKLHEGSKYQGQIYRDDDKNEHAVTELIELYSKREPIVMDPITILNESEDVWGKVKIADIVEMTIERLKKK